MATTFYGVDISDNQGSINWTTMKTALGSNGFVIIKASGFELGNTYITQTTLNTYQAGARAENLYIGYYFIVSANGSIAGLYSDANASDAADYFYDSVIGSGGGIDSGELMILDFDGTATYSDDMDTWCYDFFTELSYRFGSEITPIIYGSLSMLDQGEGAWANTASVAQAWIAATSYSSTDWTLGLTPWGAYSPSYILHQYSSVGPGMTYGVSSEYIDLDSFYSPNNSMTDFEAWGYKGSGPPPPSGTLTNVGTDILYPTYTQPQPQAIIVPKYQYDHVIFSTVFTTSVSASSWPQTIDGPETTINQYAYPFGNFTASVNGDSSTTNDFGFLYSSTYGTYAGYLPTVIVQPIIDSSGNLTFDVTVNGVGGIATVDLTINIALMATPSPSPIPLPSVSQATAYSNINPGGLPTPYSAYRRISKDSSVGLGYSTVAHGLGEIPNLLYWVEDNTGTLEMQPSGWTSAGHGLGLGVAMDATDIYINVDSANNYAFYRIYLDN